MPARGSGLAGRWSMQADPGPTRMGHPVATEVGFDEAEHALDGRLGRQTQLIIIYLLVYQAVSGSTYRSTQIYGFTGMTQHDLVLLLYLTPVQSYSVISGCKPISTRENNDHLYRRKSYGVLSVSRTATRYRTYDKCACLGCNCTSVLPMHRSSHRNTCSQGKLVCGSETPLASTVQLLQLLRWIRHF
jgi:hypothetical protein